MRKLWILCLLLITACGGPSRATPAPTPAIIYIAYSPSMGFFTEVLHRCAASDTDFVINVYESSASTLNFENVDLFIGLGGTPVDGYAFPIYEETIVLIVNANNPVLTISEEKIRDLSSGRLTSWADVGGEQQPVQVWVLPDGDDTRQLLDAVINLGDNLTLDALIAPNPRAVMEAVGDDPLAIGCVPQTWLAQEGGRFR